jgi:hypothetical protein
MSESLQSHYPCPQFPLDAKKYSLFIVGAKIQSVTTENSVVTIMGNTDFLLQGSNVSGQNVVIPDFKQSVQGSLELSNKCPTVELESEISLEEAKRLVFEYIKAHPGAKTSDLIIELCIDPEIVLDALKLLGAENKVEGKDVQLATEQK